MYSSYESEDEVVSEEDEEGKLYQYIFELAAEERKKKEEVQIPTSSGNTPVNVETDAEPGPSAVVSNTKKLDVKAQDKTPLIKTRERKPWMKPGADISDYFNYGFNEESWKNYSKKQYKVRDAKRKLHSRTVQRGRTTHEEEEEEEESRPYPYPSASRRRREVIGGRKGSGSRDEGRRHRHRHRHDGNNSQMATKTSRHKDRFTSYDLPTSSNYSSLTAFNPSPSFAYQSRPSPASSLTPMDRYSQGFDGPSTSRQPCSSGVSSFIPRTSRAGLTETSRTRERYMQDNCDRDRSRKHSRGDKDRRGRDRDNENWPSSHSVEERMKHRDTAEQRGHKHHGDGDRSNAEKQQQHDENRPRDGNKDRQNPSYSSSRRDDGEDRDAQHKKKKKSKRNTEHEKEERNLKHD